MAGTVRRVDPVGEMTDGEILEFLAANGSGIVEQVATPSGIGKERAYGRLAALVSQGLVSQLRVVAGRPGVFVIRRAGLDRIGSDLEVPVLELGRYRREVAAGWLWAWARDGMLGRVESFLSVRQMQACDAEHAGGDGDRQAEDDGDHRRAPFAVRIGPQADSQRHYPDLMLIDRLGRIAVLLLLDAMPARRLETLLVAYAADRRVAAVLVLSAHPAVTATARRVVLALGLSNLVVVQDAAVVLPDLPDAQSRGRAGDRDGRPASARAG